MLFLFNIILIYWDKHIRIKENYAFNGNVEIILGNRDTSVDIRALIWNISIFFPLIIHFGILLYSHHVYPSNQILDHRWKSRAFAKKDYRCRCGLHNETVQDDYDYESIVAAYFASLLFRYSLCYIFVSYLTRSWVVGSGD